MHSFRYVIRSKQPEIPLPACAAAINPHPSESPWSLVLALRSNGLCPELDTTDTITYNPI